VAAAELKLMPEKAATVRDALPLVPGVVRTPEGKLIISDASEHRSSLLVNALDVTDPATGKFGATVPVDAITAFNVYKSPFLAEYGRFTAGVVAVDTRGGGDQWAWELNDPTPELRIREGRLQGFRAFTPRLSFSGPLRRQRWFFKESFEYRMNKTPVRTLAYPFKESKRELWNSLTQLDYVASPTHLLTVTAHAVPQRTNFAGLSFYNPQPATPSYRGHEYTAAVTDRLTLGGGVLESALLAAQVRGRTGAQGDRDYELTPTENLGSYFFRQERRAERVQWREQYSWSSGAHHWKAGGSLIRATTRGFFRAHPVVIRDASGAVLQRLDFANHAPYRLSDWESSGYTQDHWVITPKLSLDAGLRVDGQSVSGVARFAPRVGLTWAPFGESGTSLRAGAGRFYDRVPLSLYAFDHYPERISNGVRFANSLEPSDGGRSLVAGSGYAPYATTWKAQLDHRFPRWVRLRATLLESRATGLLTVRPGAATLALDDNGRARTRQVELYSQITWPGERQMLVSYVHSRTRTNVNEFTEFLGDFPLPLVRPDVFAQAAGSIPHRLLAWGVLPVTKTIRVAPVIEYRTGFPYNAFDAAENYAAVPYSRRFPNFLAIDFRVSKDIAIGKKHAVRISFAVFNLTNHHNPDTVRWNTADPLFGQFLGHHPRRFRVDFDILR
jgi:hypothetical protein